MHLRNCLLYCFTSVTFVTFLSCKEASMKVKMEQVSADKNSSIGDEVIEVDCIFDQATQTDDFLKGIKELENYKWDTATKTAYFPSKGDWELSISRGGCDHFELSATFKRMGKFDFEKEKSCVFSKIIWITLLLEEFEGDIIKEDIEGNRLSITKENENYLYANFMNERIYESYYMDYKTENNVTEFSISYGFN